MARGASKHWGTGGYERELCDGVVSKDFLKCKCPEYIKLASRIYKIDLNEEVRLIPT